MNISQAAQQTGLSAKQIRDYEKQNLLPETQRSESRYRVYGEYDVQRLRFMRQARNVGFSLAQIRELLALQDNLNRHSRDVKNLTAQHIAELNQRIESLQSMLHTLQTWHNECSGDEQADCCILAGLNQH
ncbi:Cu(I)-responsive transcriptional regulator [Kingella kingae]|uniref:Cu(I)-responsive transcriptional regulator n=1 Tax=Kingella kingae TaxID=504 RepID=UPI000427BDB0|nr:Cu(I)-responsive transcriptional regulator [Kingella kingae]